MWIFLPLLSLLLLLYGFQQHYQGRIFPGVKIGDLPVGGLTEREARSLLQSNNAATVMPSLLVRIGDTLLPIAMNEVGYHLPVERLIRQAYSLGREGKPWQQPQQWIELLRDGKTVPLSPSFSTGAIALFVERLAQRYGRPVEEPLLIHSATNVITYPGQAGIKLDREATTSAIKKALQANQRGPVPVTVHILQPQMPDLSKMVPAAKNRLTHPFFLHLKGVGNFAWDSAMLTAVSHVETRLGPNGQPSLHQTWNEKAIRDALQRLATSIALPARDARLDYNPAENSFTVIQPSQEGRKLDIDRILPLVLDALQQGRNGVTLPVEQIAPFVDMHKTPAELGIVDLVGRGTTYFAGSSPTRVYNLAKEAESLRGTVIPPDGVFSFTKYGEPVTAANGYEDSLIIWGDRTAVGIGGGVCQVSTTVFRAAFFAGLPILERHNHGYIVSWYGKPGFDATIYLPYVDLKFKNNTGHFLLLQPVVDTKRGILTINLYGTKPNWTVTVAKPVISNVKPPPSPRYQEDKTLPKGRLRQVEWPQKGMTVQVRRIVRHGDQVIDDTTIVSVYQPWAAMYLYGPGTKIPEKNGG